MSAPVTSVTDLIETFINTVDDAKKGFRDLNRPTKVELNNLWNKMRENTANIPNPTCIGGQFELSICITNGSEWLQAEMGRINQERLEAAEQKRASENAAAAAANPPTAQDTSIILFTQAVANDCNQYPKLTNPGRFVIDVNKSADEVSIKKN